jgi:hypothetical protein
MKRLFKTTILATALGLSVSTASAEELNIGVVLSLTGPASGLVIAMLMATAGFAVLKNKPKQPASKLPPKSATPAPTPA